MAKRRNRGRPITGWLVLDKPVEMTSAQAVNAVKRLLRAAKAGHAGTLDPLAEGVLPIGLGAATRLMPWLVDGVKEYAFTMVWGEERTTDDREGEVVATSDHRPKGEEIEAALAAFTGTIEQIPPAYSAVKIDGRRAYDLARAGEDLEGRLQPREVTIHSLRLLDHDPGKGESRLVMSCGKGVYVRALVRDLARALQSRAHLGYLRRTRVGPFGEEEAVRLDRLEAADPAGRDAMLLPMTTALADIPALAVTDDEARRLAAGQSLRLPTETEGTVLIRNLERAAIAIAEVEGGVARPVRILMNPMSRS
ncbi:MAG: tRNA pseudouridine(55) synthase TruB [Alphaproteobacteria bacterium]|nr:MAG: tRNA pseudouridine(55) synthase TruB [Alphaproteobacteria bacterium]